MSVLRGFRLFCLIIPCHYSNMMIKGFIDSLKIPCAGDRVRGFRDQALNLFLFFETTDRRKAVKVLRRKQGIVYSAPNISELRAMAKYLSPNFSTKESEDLNEIFTLSEIVSNVIDFIIVTAGANAVVTIKKAKQSNNTNKAIVAKLYPVEALSVIENVSGAGDCFASGFIHGMLSGYQESYNVNLGFQSAKQALFCKNTVPEHLSINTNSINGADYVTYIFAQNE